MLKPTARAPRVFAVFQNETVAQRKPLRTTIYERPLYMVHKMYAQSGGHVSSCFF